MSLSPAASIRLGNLIYDTHAPEISATLAALPAVSSFVAALPSGIEVSAAPGDTASLDLDGGEGAQTVITGKIQSFRRTFQGVSVSVADAAARLSRLRPCATYERQNAKEVIKALAASAGVTVANIDLDLPLAAYVAHQSRTAAEHIAYLAQLAGAIALVTSAGELDVITRPGEQPDMALLYGREVIDYEVRQRPNPQMQRVLVGNGPAGAADAPDALRPSSDALPSDAPSPGADALWKPAAVLRTPKAAVAASQAANSRAAADTSSVRARCFLLPALRPGKVVEVQELPNGLSGGPWLITQVTHRLHPGAGGITVFEGQIAGAGAGSLLDAVLGAVGSFL